MVYMKPPVNLQIKNMQPAIVLCLAAFVVAVSAYTRPLEPVEVYAIQAVAPRGYVEPSTAVGPVREKRSLLLGAGLAGAGLLGAGLLGAGIAGAGLAGAGIAGAGLAGAGLGAGFGLAAGLVHDKN